LHGRGRADEERSRPYVPIQAGFVSRWEMLGERPIGVKPDLKDADPEVQVTIDPAPVGPPPMTEQEWLSFVLETGGSITDPPFVRHEH
jgi:hypothetical protein